VRGIDLDIADHEFVGTGRPSGWAKSTTLRMIAGGLEDISDGDIMIGGRTSSTTCRRRTATSQCVPELCALPAHDRRREHVVRAAPQEYPRRDQEPGREAARCSTSPSWSIASRNSCPAPAPARRRARDRAQSEVFLSTSAVHLDAKLRVQMRIEIKKVHQKGPPPRPSTSPMPGRGDDAGRRVVVMTRQDRADRYANELYHKPATKFVASSLARRR